MPKTPAYRTRKGYDQALVTLTDSRTGKRRDYWLGAHGTPASRERYHRLVAEWESLQRRLPEPERAAPSPQDPGALTVGELIVRYWQWTGANNATREREHFRPVFRMLRDTDATTPVDAYGPRRLRLLRERMMRAEPDADPPRAAWSRQYINQQTKRVQRVFKWGVSHELVPPSVTQALATLEPLKRGRTAARETEKVRPADLAIVEAAIPFMSRQAAALVRLQLLTGARPGELLGMRPADIDTGAHGRAPGGGGVWIFRPEEHKNAHRGRERTVYLGPRAQAIIAPFLEGRGHHTPLFSPAEAEAERRETLHARRKTHLSCGNRPGSNKRDEPSKTAGDRYTAPTYYRAIEYACEAAFPPPPPLGRKPGETRAQWRARQTPATRKELKAWRKAHTFTPYQLRHSAATLIRRDFGLEAAQLVLGHASATITDAVYAERDAGKVTAVMMEVG